MALPALEQGAASLLVRRVEQECKRSLEPIGDFMLVGLQRKVGRNGADDGGNHIARDRSVAISGADHFARLRLEENLLPRLTKRRCDGVLTGIEPAAWEGDLPGV